MTEVFHIPYGSHTFQFGVLRMPELSGPNPEVMTFPNCSLTRRIVELGDFFLFN